MAIKQTITVKSSPDKVYEALTSAKVFGEFTGAPADIAAQDGGAFSCFGGQITGRHVELVPNERIVQAWRAGPWPDGVYSIVCFDISKSGASTKIEFAQAGYPDGEEQHLEGGWHKMYWEPLKSHFD